MYAIAWHVCHGCHVCHVLTICCVCHVCHSPPLAPHRYVAARIATDPGWHDVAVIISGADVPGEGEHKVYPMSTGLLAAPRTAHSCFVLLLALPISGG